MNEGCTKERRQHSKITTEVRLTTEGGLIAGYGNRDVEHCYLDFLYNKKLLGAEREAQDRYYSGYALREVYYTFMPSARQDKGMARVDNKNVFTTDAEIGDEKDLAQARFNHILREIPEYARIVRMICLEDLTPAQGTDKFHGLILKGLDALKIALAKKVPEFI